MVHTWDTMGSIKECTHCGGILSEKCFMREHADCRYCGLWLVGKCPIYDKKRVSPLTNEENAFVERLRDFELSEWTIASYS